MFNTFHDVDNTQSHYMLSNSAVYGAYATSTPHYSNGTSSLNGHWELPEASLHGGSRSGPHNRSRMPNSNATSFPRSPQRSNPSFMHGGYPQYASPSYSSPMELSRPQVDYQSSHTRATLNPRLRTDQDIPYAMLSSIVPELPFTHNSTTSPESERGVTWGGSGPHGGVGNSPGLDPFAWSPNGPEAQFMSFDHDWTDAIASSMNSPTNHLQVPSHEYNFPHESSLQPHVGESHAVPRQVSPTSSSSSPPSSRRGSVDTPPGGKSCSHCHATSTPLWRREPTTLKPLCNACGLYLQQRNKHRPQELIDADAAEDLSDISEGEIDGPECSHCHTHHTSVWRRSKTGAQLCNACGVYSRLRGRDRPLSLKRNRIKPRTKHT
ncbi:hypothetical protein Hypma_013135 [Hypsizygus marmoreus]|uniref:GATA-type domain-containing protein n=1 Tax=Hypsizygus marmoreus TaxID=39966 RepID=A0A369JFX1_HYPMA|nr:hypothetical protein Hypma_013135 [Hypsizygus marmoreus]